MLKPFIGAGLFLLLLIFTLLILSGGKKGREAKAQVSGPELPNKAEFSPSEAPPASSLGSSDWLNGEPVSLTEIAELDSASEAQDIYRRISNELVAELLELKTIEDPDVIKSRLTPIVQKFYYLKRAPHSDESNPQQRLPFAFQEQVQKLEDLWNLNFVLARSADTLFHQFDLLDCEHIPYQLRAEVAAQ